MSSTGSTGLDNADSRNASPTDPSVLKIKACHRLAVGHNWRSLVIASKKRFKLLHLFSSVLYPAVSAVVIGRRIGESHGVVRIAADMHPVDDPLESHIKPTCVSSGLKMAFQYPERVERDVAKQQEMTECSPNGCR